MIVPGLNKNFLKEKYRRLPPKIRIIIFTVLICVFVASVVFGVWRFSDVLISDKKAKKDNWGTTEQALEEEILFKGEPVSVYQLREKAKLNILEIDVYNTKESSFPTYELDENQKIITQKYLGVQIKVFNPNHNQTEKLLIGLVDDLGNKYRPDYSLASYIPDLKDFGRNMNIYPRIIQEGYIFFTNINENAQKLRLIFASGLTKEKIIFEIKN